MAYDKIIVLHRRIDHCVNYVLNEEKTSLSYALAYAGNTEKSHQLVTGINCEAGTAHAEMQATKRRWDKTGGVVGYHIIHSYAPGETTPEQAHAAGVEFARRLLGDRFEAIVATHTDRDHLHCHIVFNSVSFVDGSKYRSVIPPTPSAGNTGYLSLNGQDTESIMRNGTRSAGARPPSPAL